MALSIALTVNNPVGGSDLSVTGLTDPLPNSLSGAGTAISFNGQACSAAGVSCTESANSVAIGAFSVASGQSATIAFNAVAVGSPSNCGSTTNTASANTSSGTLQASSTLAICDAALGLEKWWSYAGEDLGDGQTGKLNVADGNLVISGVDSTPIQSHGQLVYDLLRTYNSEDSGLVSFPGQLAQGWTLSVGGAGAASGTSAGEVGLYVPSAESVATPLAVTLIGRNGERHVLQPVLPRPTPIDVTSAVSGDLAAVNPKVVTPSAGNHLCVDTLYQASAGIHLSVLRYIGVTSSAATNPCGNPDAGTTPTVAGFAIERPDRIRYEFAADGRILDLSDGSGVELRYLYDTSNRLTTVYEPLSCANPATLSCRAFRFTYGALETDVTDPAGRQTRYVFDSSTPARLVTVVNPDGSTVGYTYGSTCGGNTAQVCTVTDARGHATSFQYLVPAAGLPIVSSVTDRRGTGTTISYFQSPTYVTVDSGTERTRYTSIDSSGRAGEIDEGDTKDTYLRQTILTWDAPGSTCRQPDAMVDNDLCQVIRRSLTLQTPDGATSYVYNDEGRPLSAITANGASSVASTYGYHSQYVQVDGSVAQFDDTVAGGGSVSSQGPRGAPNTVFVISDLTQQLSPNGNAVGSAPAAFGPFTTTFRVDNNAAVGPNSGLSGTICSNPSSPSSNTGHVCERDGPQFDQSGQPAVTRYTYDAFGEKTSTLTPLAVARNQTASYVYSYYQDSDLEMSGNLSAGGWLKAITDPAGRFAAFGYDRAGNVARTWDRNATAAAGLTLASYPGTLSSSPSPAYTEVVHGSYLTPWRWVTSNRDQLGDLTTFPSIDPNGNVTTVRPPRGSQASTTTYDTTSTYDNNDEILSSLAPMEALANRPTQYTYDSHGNLTAVTDPNGNITVRLYDAVNRQVGGEFTRGPWPSDGSQPATCRQSTAADAPIPSGRILCSIAVSYDGVDNQLTSSDADQQTTSYTYDAVHDMIKKVTPRNDGQYTTLVTEATYDSDGNVLDVCPPREFTEGGSLSCSVTGVYSQHVTYGPLGKLISKATYRSAGTSPNTATYTYDADGNRIQESDPNGEVVTDSFDLLDRRSAETRQRDSTTNITTSWTYDPSGNTTSAVEPATTSSNRVTAYSYDAVNRPVDTVVGADNTSASQAGLVDSNGGSNVRTRLVYDADGHVVAKFLPEAFSTSTTTPDPTFMVRTDYDADGRKSAQWAPRYDSGAHSDLGLGSSTQSTQCPGNATPQVVPGAPAYPTSVGVCVTRYAFDYNGHRTQVLLPTSTGGDNRFVNYTYTDDNLVANVNAPSPATAGARVTAESYLYDANGRVVKTTDALGLQKTRSYTSDGMLGEITNQPNGTITHIQDLTYDANGNSATQMPVPGQKWIYTYYSDNLTHTVADPAGNQTQYNYDPVGHPTQVYSPSAVARDANNTSGSPTTFSYTLDGLLNTEVTPVSPDGTRTRTTSYGYDLGGRKTSQSVQFNGGPTSSQQVSYYPDDRVQTETGRSGETITTGYAPSGNAKTITDSTSATTISATYYLDGLLRSADDSSVTSQFAYDGLDQRSARSDLVDGSPTAYTATYTYNDAELLQEITSPYLGNFFFNYTPGYLDYTYDAAGRPQSQLYAAGTPKPPLSNFSLNLTWSFNPDNTLAEQQVPQIGPGFTPLSDWKYTYDSSYRLSSANFTGMDVYNHDARMTEALSYAYDAAGRVTSYNDGSGARQVTWDHNSNRLTYGNQSFSYNADNSLNQTGTTYYDFGGLQGDTCSAYSYDGFDRLRSVTPNGGSGCSSSLKSITYTYDGLDRQRSAATTSATTNMHYDGLSQVVSNETDSAGNTVPYVLEPAGQRVGLHYWASGYDNVQFLVGDGRGNIATVWEGTGSGPAPDCQIFLDPWGTPMAPGTPASPCAEGSTPNSYFYKGARLDQSTGDFELGSRTYDPGKAAFLTPDATRTAQSTAALSVGTDPLTENRYAYVNGDPVNLVDPEGHSPFDFLGGAISSGLSAVGSFASWAWSGVQQVAGAVWSGITSIASDVWSAVTGAASAVGGAISSAASSVTSAFNTTVSSLQSAFSSIEGQIQQVQAQLQRTEQLLNSIEAQMAQAQQQAAAFAQQVQAQWASLPKAVAGVDPFAAFQSAGQAIGGAASSAEGWFNSHAGQIKNVAQGVGTACGLATLIAVADMVTVPCMLVANGVALAADADLAAHGQQGWGLVGMDALGVGASVVGLGALGGASELTRTIAGGAPDASEGLSFTERQLQSQLEQHGADFGITGPNNTATREAFLSRLVDHIDTASTTRIEGTYRGQAAIHYLHPEYGRNVVTTPEGGFWAAWRLGPAQIENVLLRGSLR